ncbi:MAG: hypothetical protein HRT41_14685 [Campylobacteraceae bacterium]|nr:hypothetical protein [Campylobacteraceae bacterium]
MKKITKTLLGISAMLLPLSLMAGEIKYSQNQESVISKGLSFNITGTINKKPMKGLYGTWSIDGKDLWVDKHTFISNPEKIKTGDKISVLANNQYGKLFAIRIN